MGGLNRLVDWPLRLKVVALLIVASVLPLGAAAFFDIKAAREQVLLTAAALLTARGDHPVDQLDALHRGYQREASNLAHMPEVFRFLQARSGERDGLVSPLRAVLGAHQATDPNLLVPVLSPDRRILGAAALWIRASVFWGIVKSTNALAGPGSFAVLFDRQGVRIAHSYDEDIVYYPGGQLDPASVTA